MIAWSNALELLFATAIASALGSLHCVGMCGPFAIMVLGERAVAANGQLANVSQFGSKRDELQRMMAYHLGRLVTYVTMGMIVGLLVGSLGQLSWLRSIGLWVGLALIGVGGFRLLNALLPEFLGDTKNPVKHGKWVHAWSMQLAKLRQRLPRNHRWQSAFGWGLTTTLLPCGWLYVFVLTAAASTSSVMAIATMIAFWFGTLPLLSISVWGWRLVGNRWRSATGVVSSLCILTMGIYLMIVRSTGELPMPSTLLNQVSAGVPDSMGQGEEKSSLAMEQETGLERLTRLKAILNEGLPCCRSDSAEGSR